MSQKFPGGFITKNPTAPTTAAAKGIWTLDQVTNYVKQGIWPATPGAPTIGTATAGIGSATVTYTAPTNLGSGTVTYTATSSPGGLTGTGASPITVSGLTNGTAYTFTVTASTPGGTGPASAASNSVTPALPVIGAAFGGGFYAGQISTAGTGVATHNLVVGPVASAQNTSKQWKTANTSTSGTASVINGPANSTAMNNASHPAAQFCEAVNTGGQTDWYMPAKDELEVCYYNLKPDTTGNSTGSGTNTNAVPSRGSNYTSGTPARTSASAFQTGGAEAFTALNIYWSSTEQSSSNGFSQTFDTGNQGFYSKDYTASVRAIRRVAV
ncbi:Fibronectin type III [uncultured Caudovirales phage]|uniref:Fibronectin type III n=1 Tax=uncultured Caudovirales phage TaxID=2100421 RepID=A0A6J5S6J6_9CAUD|nr:Fibronectin type III [uncultured Caudovirales phage]CAB4173052.1 Fibronectin type III [uncultured Caudovirales phage]CAB4184458.1 Fibronectin type III [uncultured Caudovirales phage]CAB4204158.1 Fibronectin type III [uncultured Caudovirales phage]CAB5238208.1 Fibronectin type III [uncultured Caudovirales phage]